MPLQAVQKVVDQPVTSREKKIVSGFTIVYILCSLLIIFLAAVPLRIVPLFASLTNVVLTVTAFQTAYLLYVQSKLLKDGSLSILACGYSVASLFALAYVIFYPGLFHGTIDDEYYNTSVAWLSLLGHANFSIAVILYSLIYGQIINIKNISPQTLFRSSFLYAILSILFFVYGHKSFLPVIIAGNSYHLTASFVLAITLLVLSIIAFTCVFIFTNLSLRQNLWLSLAVFVHIMEIVYGAVGQTRFSVGWYAARVNQVFSFSIVLGVLTYHLSFLTRKLSEANNKLEEIATMDFLTKICNRRKFIITLDNYWDLAQRDHKPLCLIMIDIDHFKIYNDTFGHLAGDECLIRVAQELKRIFKRHSDIVSRIGGEEFAILLYNVSEKEGKKIAEKIRRSIENLKLQTFSTKQPHVTVSIGCATVMANKQVDPTFIIDVADQALYEAKFKGRNKVVTSSFFFAQNQSQEQSQPNSESAPLT